MLLISSDELISSPARPPEPAGTGGGVAAAPAAAPATDPCVLTPVSVCGCVILCAWSSPFGGSFQLALLGYINLVYT